MELQEQQREHVIWKRAQQVVSSFGPRRKVPQLLQMGAVECGAACLAMILSYYGRKTSVSEIREHCGLGRNGLSAQHLVRAAQDFGLRTRAIALRENDFRHVKLPAIIHWEFDHFLIVERWKPGRVDVVDPAIGRRCLTRDEFDQGFTGVVLLFEPGVQFHRRRIAPGINLSGYLMTCFKQAPWAFVQILVASLLLQLFGLGVPLLTDIVVDLVIARHMPSLMTMLGMGIAVILLSQLVTMGLRALLLIYLQARVDTYMMLSFIEHLLTLPLRFFQQHATGDIINRLGSNTAIREVLSNQLVSAILDGSFVTVYLLLLFLRSPVFGFLVLGIGLAQALLLLCTTRPVRELALRELIAQGRTQGYGNEVLAGIVSLKAAGAEQRAFERWSNYFFDQINSSIRHNTFSSLLQTATNLFQMAAPLLLLWVGTMLVLNGTMPLGTMLFLNALAISFLTPLSSLVSSGQRLQVVRSHLERLTDVIEAQPEQCVQDVSRPGELTGQITLEHVSFRYDPHSPDVLKDIHITIEAGQRIAIVGRTGSGKSTLGKLLLGLYLPTAGEIRYDGVPLQNMNYQAVRAQFGVVMQEATVFGGTIRQNIAFNDPQISLERVMDAAQRAMLHEEVQAMPMSYETYISEQGSALSGGQRQRLALARALAHSPAVLLLDEATSALDVVTERRVEENLRASGCTQIIIAHRLSTIRDADLILVLHEGTIVERGTHAELLALHGRYAELVQSQFVNPDAQSH